MSNAELYFSYTSNQIRNHTSVKGREGLPQKGDGSAKRSCFFIYKIFKFFSKIRTFQRNKNQRKYFWGGGSQWEIGKSENDEIPGLGMLEIKGRIDIATFTINE